MQPPDIVTKKCCPGEHRRSFLFAPSPDTNTCSMTAATLLCASCRRHAARLQIIFIHLQKLSAGVPRSLKPEHDMNTARFTESWHEKRCSDETKVPSPWPDHPSSPSCVSSRASGNEETSIPADPTYRPLSLAPQCRPPVVERRAGEPADRNMQTAAVQEPPFAAARNCLSRSTGTEDTAEAFKYLQMSSRQP